MGKEQEEYDLAFEGRSAAGVFGISRRVCVKSRVWHLGARS